MADLKKKFIDILFEENDEEEESVVSSAEAVKRSESPIKAKDVLYRKSSNSVFVNLNEQPKTVEQAPVQEEKPNVYEMSSQISPIFGVIKENKPKTVNYKPEITESQTNKPSDSHLDIITSPIYGYGNKEDTMDNDYDVKSITDENEEDELHHLFDEEESLNNSYNDMQNDSSDEEISLFRLFGDNK